MSASMASLLLSLLLVVLSSSCVRCQNVPVYFCWLSFSDPQTSNGAVWTESISGNITVSPAAFSPLSVTMYSAPIISLVGTRTYSTPSANWSSSVTLGASGTDGSSNNLMIFIQNSSFASADSRQLDTTGITLTLASAQPLAGTSSMVTSITIKWSSASQTYVQVSNGQTSLPSRYTSWSPQLLSGIGSPVTTSIPQCLASNTATSLVFSFCVDCYSSNYTNGDWRFMHYGIMTLTNPLGQVQTRASHTELDSSSVMTGLVGVRVWQQADVYYTGQDYPPVTSIITGLQGLPYGDGGPDNLLAFAAPWLTGNGYTYNIYPSQPIGNVSQLPQPTKPLTVDAFGGNYSDINFYYNGYGYFGNYREVNEPNHEAVCLWERSSYTYVPYVPGTDPQAVCLATTVQTKTWGFCAQMFGASSSSDQWGVAYSGYFTTTGLPFTDKAYTGLPVYFTTSMRGTRTYTNYVTKYTESANIIYLQPQGGDAGTDNLFYWPSMSPFSQISWNRNGFSVTFDHNVTETGTSVMYPDLNVYYNGNLRETNDLGGGYHEEVGCIGQFTVVPYTGIGPTCTLPATVPSCPTATQQFDLCYIAVGPSNGWAVAISATVTGGPFGLDYGGSGGGYREYTIVTGISGSRTSFDSSLSASQVSINSVTPGGVLYSVSSSYSYLSPGALLNASGITFGLASSATVPGAASTSSINLFSPAIGTYQENSGTVPSYSYLRHTYLNSAVGNRYCTPSFQPAGCAASSGSLPSGSISVQVMVSSPSWSTISSNPVFGYQLMEDIAYTIGTGQLYALPLMSCASASQTGGTNTMFTILISNAAGNATALAAAIQAQVLIASTTPFTTRQSGAVLSNTVYPLTSSSCPTTSSSSSSGLSHGAIAGIVIGSVVGAVLVLLICFLLMGFASRRDTSNAKPARMQPSEESQVSRQEAAEMTETRQ